MQNEKCLVLTKQPPSKLPFKSKRKGKYYTTQEQTALRAFSVRPKTMLMVSIETGIFRANITRYIAKWEEENRIDFIGFGMCKISKHRAGYYQAKKQTYGETTEEL